jgi:hypothetical protein
LDLPSKALIMVKLLIFVPDIVKCSNCKYSCHWNLSTFLFSRLKSCDVFADVIVNCQHHSGAEAANGIDEETAEEGGGALDPVDFLFRE